MQLISSDLLTMSGEDEILFNILESGGVLAARWDTLIGLTIYFNISISIYQREAYLILATHLHIKAVVC